MPGRMDSRGDVRRPDGAGSGSGRRSRGRDLSEFKKPAVKRHDPTAVRENAGQDYRGCLAISVRRSAGWYRAIEGWAGATVQRLTAPARSR